MHHWHKAELKERHHWKGLFYLLPALVFATIMALMYTAYRQQ